MLKVNLRSLSLLVMLFLVAGVSQVSALIVEQPGYIVEEFVSYGHPGLLGNAGNARDLAFDDMGNLYVTHSGHSSSTQDGSIYRIDSSGDVSLYMTGFFSPYKMEWTGGTAYGENIYVADVIGENIVQMDTNQNGSYFSTSLNQPSALGFDRTGSYGGLLYTATCYSDSVYSVSTDGQYSLFCNDFRAFSGSPEDLEFDTTGNYDGKMFMAYYSANDSSVAGVYIINPDGTSDKFTGNDMNAWSIKFDAQGLFDNKMYVTGRTGSDVMSSIYTFDADGSYDRFISSDINILRGFTFGDDGAMYVHEYGNGISTISRITPVPEPTTIALMGMGLVCLSRRRKRA